MPENKSSSTIRSIAVAGLITILVASLLVVVAYFVDGPTIATRSATDLVMPVGLTWLGLWAAANYFSLRRQWSAAVFAALLFALVGVSGNRYLSSKFIEHVEMPEQQPSATRGNPYRTVVVLGGGTKTTPLQTAELHRDGERIFSAAQLWHAGLVSSITCSGSDPHGAKPPRDLAAKLLESVGVPAGAIFRFAGENTTQEMQALRKFLTHPPDGFPESGEIALITSAYHMNRAVRLAGDQGLELDPLPCGYRSDYLPNFSPRLLIPEAGAASVFGAALKEMLAGLVGR